MIGCCLAISDGIDDPTNTASRSEGETTSHNPLGSIGVVDFRMSAYENRGAATKDLLLDTYLQALRRKDEQAILSLVPTTQVAQEAVRDKLKKLGGHTYSQVWIEYTPLPNSRWVKAKVCFTKDSDSTGSPEGLCDELVLQKIGVRWYLMLGQHRDAGAPPPTIQP